MQIYKWDTWVPRDVQAPDFSKKDNILTITSKGKYDYGKWCTTITDIVEGESYSFFVKYKTQNVEWENTSVKVVLTWQNENGEMQTRDYVDVLNICEDGWNSLSRVLDAPRDAVQVCVELGFCFVEGGSVTFKDWNFTKCQPLGKRILKIATTYINPYIIKDKTFSGILKELIEMIDNAGRENPDIICLSETINDRGIPISTVEKGVPIPGDFTNALSEKAREYKTYIIASLHEIEDDMIYNTAVLIDRNGEIVGKYRKTHLALIEGENGVVPGESCPVFETDFGRIGILICWDHYFPEPARIMSQKGAEILFVSTAGDAPIQSLARAIDNGVYMVISGVNKSDMTSMLPSRIISPNGNVISQTDEHKGSAFVTIDLNKRHYSYWLSVGAAFGEARSIYKKERKAETYLQKEKEGNI